MISATSMSRLTPVNIQVESRLVFVLGKRRVARRAAAFNLPSRSI